MQRNKDNKKVRGRSLRDVEFERKNRKKDKRSDKEREYERLRENYYSSTEDV